MIQGTQTAMSSPHAHVSSLCTCFYNVLCSDMHHEVQAAQKLSGQQCATGGTGRQCATGGTWRPFIHRSSIHPKLHSSEDMSNLLQTMSPRIGRIGKKRFPGAVCQKHLAYTPAPPAACNSEAGTQAVSTGLSAGRRDRQTDGWVEISS